jgi:hypothetical protein
LTGVTEEQTRVQTLLDRAKQLVEEVRTKFRAADATGGFPIAIRDRAYTRAQAVAQVRLLLTEIKGYTRDLDTLTAVARQLEDQIQDLSQRVNSGETQLSLIAPRRELIRTRGVAGSSGQVIREVEELLNPPDEEMVSQPVRSIRELVKAVQVKGPVESAVSTDDAVSFLGARPAEENRKPSPANGQAEDLSGGDVSARQF